MYSCTRTIYLKKTIELTGRGNQTTRTTRIHKVWDVIYSQRSKIRAGITSDAAVPELFVHKWTNLTCADNNKTWCRFRKS